MEATESMPAVQLMWENLTPEARDGFFPSNGMVVHGMPNERYHQVRAASKSTLGRILESPYQVRHGTDEGTPAMEFGTLAHTLLLEPETFEERYAVVPEGMVRNAKHKVYQAFLAEAGDRECVKANDVANARLLARAVRAHPSLAKYLDDPRVTILVEVSLFWEDPTTGVLCRCRADLLIIPHDLDQPIVCFDLKTFPGVPTYGAIQYHGEKTLGWPTASAFYSDGVTAVYGRPCDFVIIAAQKVPPFEVSMVAYSLGGLEDEVYQYGKKRYLRGLEVYRHCLETDTYPPAIQKIAKMELSSWAQRELNQES